MFAFIRKKVTTDKNLGEILKKAREEKHFGLYYISQTLKIPERYLEALEQSQYDKLPDQVYTKNFLKAYCKFLRIDFDEIYTQFRSELAVFQKTGKSQVEKTTPVKKTSPWSFFITPKLIRGFLIVLVLVISITYLGVKVKAIFSPPYLIITKPTQDLVIENFQIEIQGQTEVGAILKINDRQVLPDNLGFFSDTVNLKEGINIIEIKAKKRYSREAVVERVIQVVK